MTEQEALTKIWVEIKNLNHARLSSLDEETLIYKQLNISKNDKEMIVYDNTTDMYKPLTSEQIIELARLGAKAYCVVIKKRSLLRKLQNERKRYHIESIKKNLDKAERHFKRALKCVEQLRNLKLNSQ